MLFLILFFSILGYNVTSTTVNALYFTPGVEVGDVLVWRQTGQDTNYTHIKHNITSIVDSEHFNETEIRGTKYYSNDEGTSYLINPYTTSPENRTLSTMKVYIPNEVIMILFYHYYILPETNMDDYAEDIEEIFRNSPTYMGVPGDVKVTSIRGGNGLKLVAEDYLLKYIFNEQGVMVKKIKNTLYNPRTWELESINGAPYRTIPSYNFWIVCGCVFAGLFFLKVWIKKKLAITTN